MRHWKLIITIFFLCFVLHWLNRSLLKEHVTLILNAVHCIGDVKHSSLWNLFGGTERETEWDLWELNELTNKIWTWGKSSIGEIVPLFFLSLSLPMLPLSQTQSTDATSLLLSPYLHSCPFGQVSCTLLLWLQGRRLSKTHSLEM